MTTALMILIVVLMRGVPMVIAGIFSHRKHRNVILWVVFALFLPLPALIAILLVSPLVPAIRCTQCKRFSWATAKTCPYCNIAMPEGPIEQAPDPAGRSAGLVAGLVIGITFFIIALIGILAAIAIPRFSNNMSRAKEMTLRAQLAVVRSGLSLYAADHQGKVPARLEDVTAGGKYIQKVPTIVLPKTPFNTGHPASAAVTYGSLNKGVTDTGGWVYNPNSQDPERSISINCSHRDLHGKRWDQY